jgi:hypothetical protein
VSTQEPYRLGSLGDLVELLVDGWEIAAMHYSETCGDLDVPDGKAAAFVSLTRPDNGAQGIFIPEDERAFSHKALMAVFRESPRIWKYRNPDTIHARLAELSLHERPDPEAWQDVPDPADLRLDVSPANLQGVVALGQVESIADVTVALLSLERYNDFSRLRYLAHTDDAVRRGSIAALDVLVVDDRGRRYRTATVGVERAGSRLEGVMVLAPGIPREAVSLTITIGSLGEAGPTGPLGPWVFPIKLPTPSR